MKNEEVRLAKTYVVHCFQRAEEEHWRAETQLEPSKKICDAIFISEINQDFKLLITLA